MLGLWCVATLSLHNTPGAPVIPSSASGASLTRRAILAPAVAAALLPVRPARAESLETYTDSRYGVSFDVPAGWTAVPNQLADGRRLVVASDPKDASNNVFIAFTPIRPDYSSLGSFGTIDFVANTVLPQCGDLSYACSFKQGDDIDAKMLSQSTIKGNYVYDYSIEIKGGPKRRLQSLFTVQADGGSSILVGLSAQSLDSNYGALASTFKDVINSYKGTK